MLNPRRISAFRTLWRSARRGRRPDAPGIGERVRSLPRLIRSSLSGSYPELGRGRMAMFLLALLYLVAPVDVVPELFLSLLGLTDDAVVALWLGGAFLRETDRFLSWERAAAPPT